VSEENGSEVTGQAGAPAACSHLHRAFDLCVFAPVGVAISVVEDLPGLVAKGRKRVEVHLGNARVVGRYVVGKSQRTLSGHLEGLLGSAPAPDTATEPEQDEPEAPAPRPVPDPAAGAVVAAALADYDTLSASQVVRRLESLGPDELRAVQRYEASARNRRTILNRAGQLLGERSAAQAGHQSNGAGSAGPGEHEVDGAGAPGPGC